MYGVYETIREFLFRGGNVMVILAWVVFFMWTLIIERLIFLLTENRRELKAVLSEWESRAERKSWEARAIYDGAVSELSIRFESGVPMIRTLARLCPLFGLMGTVTGMILIFDVMAQTGGNSPKAMAAGVAKATLTTMAGMVGALSGIFPAAILGRYVQDQEDSLLTHRLSSSGISLLPLSGLPRTLRWLLAPTMAAVVTAGLLFLMQTLIETGEAAIQKTADFTNVEFIRVRQEERIETRSKMPEKLIPDEKPQTIAQLPDPDIDDGGITIGISVPSVEVGGMNMDTSMGAYAITDAEFMPIVRVEPLYPAKAEQMGLSGYVFVTFTVTITGAVKNVVVVESTNRVFNRPAIRAVEKWKYKPRIINGVPVEVHGIKTKLTFELLED